MDIISQLNHRYATKAFDTTKSVSDADLKKLLEAIRLSASSYGLMPYKVIVVKDPEVRKQLRAAAWNQGQITDGTALLVFAADANLSEASVDKFIDRIVEVRKMNKADLAGYSDMMKGSVNNRTPEQLLTWASKQAYIALGYGLVAAATLGIDTCPMEGFDPAEFDRILGLEKQGLKSAVILAVGVRSADDYYQHLAKVRPTDDDFFVQI